MLLKPQECFFACLVQRGVIGGVSQFCDDECQLVVDLLVNVTWAVQFKFHVMSFGSLRGHGGWHYGLCRCFDRLWRGG
ncbi:hypothetical protein D3C75_936450 [compost metagenome]